MKNTVSPMSTCKSVCENILTSIGKIVSGVAVVLSLLILVAHFTTMQFGAGLEFLVAYYMPYELGRALTGKGEELLLIFAITVMIIFIYKKVSKKLSI